MDMKIDGKTNLAANDSISGKQGGNSEADAIKREIKRVQDQITDLANNKDLSIEEKRNKKKALTEQLTNLNKQLVDIQIEQQKVEQEKRLAEIQKRAEETAIKQKEENKEKGGLSSVSVQAILSASSSINEARSINHVRTKMIGDAHELEGTIAISKSKGQDTTGLQYELSELKKKIGDVTTSVIEKYSEANESMKAALKLENEAVKKEKDRDAVEDKDQDAEEAQNADPDSDPENAANDQKNGQMSTSINLAL